MKKLKWALLAQSFNLIQKLGGQIEAVTPFAVWIRNRDR